MLINRIKTAIDNSSEINKQVLEKKSADVTIYYLCYEILSNSSQNDRDNKY